MNNRLTYPGKLALATSVLLLLCIGFGWWQSGEGRVGGPMSPAKILWLFLALVHFYLVPFWLWKDPGLSTSWRRVWGLFFLGFLIRAVLEIPMLLLTRAWRCEHGIAHDAVMLVSLIFLVRRIPRMEKCQIRPFAWLAGVALVFEALNAWMFSKIGNPEAGIYFASNESHFRMINFITWCEIAILFPLFLWWLLKYNRSER
jgi:membrane protein YdbS with pleckstrin-like domain